MLFNVLTRVCRVILREGRVTTTAQRTVVGNKFYSNNNTMHSTPTVIQGQSMTIKILPALEDNFMYLIIDEETKDAAIVDPVNPSIVMTAVQESNVNLTKILTTHHHWDHAGGNKEMCEKHEKLVVYGGDKRIEAINQLVTHDDTLNIGNLKVKCLATPCHTSGHICYYVTGTAATDVPSIFTGDTLFLGGCGRFFEGTAAQMFTALHEIIGSLPDDTKVYCGHEYTCKNLAFGLAIEPNNEDIKKKLEWAKRQRENMCPTVPSTIGEEKKINPFMRVLIPSVMAHTATSDPIETMAILRTKKDKF